MPTLERISHAFPVEVGEKFDASIVEAAAVVRSLVPVLCCVQLAG